MGINWQYYHWHLEPSSVCALRCPRCPRTEHPDTPWLNQNMSLDFVKSFLTEDMLKNHVKRITMCGDVGDPIYCPDFIEICRYIKSVNPRIHIFTITCGSHKKEHWWQELAGVLNEYDSINFSVDGYNNETNNMYRVNSKWDTIINGIKTLREHNKDVFINWAAIVFKFNQDHLDYIESMAKDLGMDILQITKSTKFGSKYGAAYQGENDNLEPDPQWISSTHRYERFTKNISGRTQNNREYLEHNLKKYREVKEQYQDQPIVPMCEIGNRGVYVNAEGVLFPCSWVSFPYTSLNHGDKTIKWEDSFFSVYRQEMNLRHNSFESVINNTKWNMCSRGWTDSSKSWVECSQKCNQDLVDQNYAVGWETN